MRYQITIKDMMLATFWVGVGVAAWLGALRVGRQPHPRLMPGQFQVYETLALAALGWSCIFPAIWALLGRARKGVVIGVGMWVFMLILSLFVLV